MRRLLPLVALCANWLVAESVVAAENFFELRIYTVAPGKAAALHSRFRDHTLKLFAKHEIKSVGYWSPLNAPEEKVVFLLAYPSLEVRESRWKAFVNDPEWKAAYAASEANGPLVTKVDQYYLTPTDYSPAKIPAAKGDRVFELRTYHATPGNLAKLHDRFRQHTTKLFEKHGMTNVIYFQPPAGQRGADDTLIYFLAHASEEAGKASFAAFRQDPTWVAARKASEEAAGGSLTTVPDGVQSLYLKATDYSPLK